MSDATEPVDLDRLERFAREAPPGPYTLCPAPYWDVLDAECRPVRAAWLPAFARYVHVAQPDAVLALVRRLRAAEAERDAAKEEWGWAAEERDKLSEMYEQAQSSLSALRRELDALREATRDVLRLPTSSADDAAVLFTEGMSGPVHPPEVYEEARERQAIRERAAALAQLARPG